jgi:prevent-host-death family protein
MTKIELKKASEPLSKYAQKARKDPVIVVKKGKPFAAVVPIRNADEETVSLSTNRKFLAIIERSRSRTKKEGAISSNLPGILARCPGSDKRFLRVGIRGEG